MSCETSSPCFCVICNYSLDSSDIIPSNEDKNLLLILAKNLNVDVDLHKHFSSNSLSSSSEATSVFCINCKKNIDELMSINKKIQLLQGDKFRLILSIVSNVIISCQNRNTNQNQVRDKNTESNYVKSNANDSFQDNSTLSQIKLLRQQIFRRYCPIVNLNNMKPSSNTTVLSSKNLSSLNNNSDSDLDVDVLNGDDSDSTSTHNCITEESSSAPIKKSTPRRKPRKQKSKPSSSRPNRKNKTNSATSIKKISENNSTISESEKLPKKTRRSKYAPPLSPQSLEKRKEELKERSRKYNLKRKILNSKIMSGALSQTDQEYTVKPISPGQFIYRNKWRFEETVGAPGFKCSTCSRLSKSYIGMILHIRAEHHKEPRIPRKKRKQNQNEKQNEEEQEKDVEIKTESADQPNDNSNDNDSGKDDNNEGISKEKCDKKQQVVVLECGGGKFLVNDKWPFHQVSLSTEFPTDNNPIPMELPTQLKFQCDTCRKTTNTRTHMVSHIRDRHEAPLLFICHICSKEFHVKKNFENHLFTHSNERPYVCTICNAAFKYKPTLVNHQKKHEGKYDCPKCGKSFGLPNSLKLHLENHDGERTNMCNECGALFSKQIYLKGHIERVHEKIKKYFCSIPECAKGFYDATHLKKHMITHQKNNQM